MKKLLAASFAVLASLAFACSGGSKAAAGTYELDKAAFKQALLANVPEAQRAEAAAGMDKMVDAMQITADLKPDGTATMESKGGMAPQSSETGTWKLDGNKLTLTVKNKDTGKDDSHTGDYANGAFTMEMGTEGPTKMKMTFRKK